METMAEQIKALQEARDSILKLQGPASWTALCWAGSWSAGRKTNFLNSWKLSSLAGWKPTLNSTRRSAGPTARTSARGRRRRSWTSTTVSWGCVWRLFCSCTSILRQFSCFLTIIIQRPRCTSRLTGTLVMTGYGYGNGSQKRKRDADGKDG